MGEQHAVASTIENFGSACGTWTNVRRADACRDLFCPNVMLLAISRAQSRTLLGAGASTSDSRNVSSTTIDLANRFS
jgi:hypothetical protein